MGAFRFKPLPPVAGGLLALALVALTTWALFGLQLFLTAAAGGHYVRPYGIGYILPVALATALGGYRVGLFTLGLSALAAVYALTPPRFTLTVRDPREWAELVFLLLIGGLVVAGGEAMRRNLQLLQQSSEAAAREREATERHQEAAARQRRFLRDVLASVTDNRLHLCDARTELPAALEPVGEPVALGMHDLRSLRQRACQAATAQGFADERVQDLMTAVAEAAMNAVVHGGGGVGRVCVDPCRTVQVWVEDQGRGIAVEHLPRATLERGHSTAGTLGHGFWLMLQTCDRLWLLTGPEGTTVVLEQDRPASEPPWLREAS